MNNLLFLLNISVLFVLIFSATGKYNEIPAAIAQMDPQDTSILVTKGYALDNSGNYSGAVEYFDHVLDIEPNNVDALTWKH
jgi:tetratricopeptide (TPR) repeat protein